MAQALAQDLASQFRQFITTGRWEVGSQLPALRQLADEQGVSVNTARAAMQELAEESLIDWRHGRRGVVTALPAKENHSTRRGRPKHIGLLGLMPPTTMTAMPDSWAGHIAAAAESVLLKGSAAYLTRLCPRAASREQRAEEVIEQIGQFGDNLTGVIVFASKNPHIHQVFDELDRRDIPWVAIDRPDRAMLHNFVAPDYLAQGQLIGDFFAKHHHPNIWIISPDPATSVSWSCNIAGVYQGLVQAGQSTSGVRHLPSKDVSESAGFEAAATALRETLSKPQAIYAIGDYLALGAIRALRDSGLNVPEDVEVIGGTGLDSSAHTSPPLSVLAQPMDKIGRAAAKMLLDMQQSGNHRQVGKKVSSQLILRESTLSNENPKSKEPYKPNAQEMENVNDALLVAAA